MNKPNFEIFKNNNYNSKAFNSEYNSNFSVKEESDKKDNVNFINIDFNY